MPTMMGKAISRPKSKGPFFSVKPVLGSTTSTGLEAIEEGTGVENEDDEGDENEGVEEEEEVVHSAFLEAARAMASSLCFCNEASALLFASAFRL